MINFLNSLSPAQNIMLAFGLLVLGLIVMVWLFVLIENRPAKIETMPTEEELKRRDEEGKHRAYLAYTKGDKGKAA